jgi:autotransporter-associated beta strand protein
MSHGKLHTFAIHLATPARTARVSRIWLACPLAICLPILESSSPAAAYVQTAGTESWNNSANWDPAAIPNAVGEAVVFDDPTEARTITVDSGAAGFTVGSITFNNNTPFRTTLDAGVADSNLRLNNGGVGVSLIFNGTGDSLANQTVLVPMIFEDNVTAHINYASNSTSGITTQGAFNWTGPVSGGSGGFTKMGPFVMTMGSAQKRYTGPTVLETDSGRTRISVLGRPSATSSFTVRSGAQIELITAGIYSFGTGPLNLNGTGLGPGSLPGDFPGAIRPVTNLAATITNPVVLESDSLIHVQGAAAGILTLEGPISGPGQLTLTASNSNSDLGTLIVSGLNSYQGGTIVNGGSLVVSGGAGSLGTGDVFVHSANAMIAFGASARLALESGVLNAIADNALLSLAGGGLFAGFADDGYLELQAGVNETVGALLLGGVSQAPGTYGSTLSTATFKDDEYFSGSGILTVIPEPTAFASLLGGVAALGLLRRQRR